MEANNHALQATPHKCDQPVNGHYSSCDRGGCEQNTRDEPDAYGPGKGYTIDTTRPFRVETEFMESAGSFSGMRTTLRQGEHQVVLDHSSCDAEYLASLSDALAAGMSLRITYWGDEAETMAWMDSPPCGRQSCGDSAGKASISNMSVGALPAQPLTHSPSLAPATTPQAEWSWEEPSQIIESPSTSSLPSSSTSVLEKQVFSTHPITIAGFQPATLVGDGGSVDGGNLTMRHNSGFTLFSKFAEEWDPANIAQLKVLGKVLRFTVDLSDVGCACNLAFYLISAPARDWNGRPSPGTDRGGQPPYYCDANKVGGQWCPEIDIMEANNRAFQATPHKCDEPVNGHYSSCDRSGCEQSTRDVKIAYGPGNEYTIDTRYPFEVATEFLEAAGVFSGMKTSLHQSGRRVVLDHSECKAAYLGALTDALKEGMSLRVTYWGDEAETMAWMDSPTCGQQSCSGTNAGKAVISSISLEKYVWAVNDPEDPLFRHVVPDEVVEDSKSFVTMGSMGLANWKSGTHFVQRQTKVASPTLPGLEDCDDEVAGPCQISLKKSAGFLQAVVKRYEGLPSRGAFTAWAVGGSWVHQAAAVAVVCFLLFAMLVAVRLRLRGAGSRRGVSMPGPPASADAGGTSSSGLRAPWISVGETTTTANAIFAGPGGLPRSGSSCQQLLVIHEGAC